MIKEIFLFILALLLALIEIEIEGKNGWAEKIPTWYRKKGKFMKIWNLFNNQRPMTGYHLFMMLFLALFFHLEFFLGLNWSMSKELEILSIFIILVCAWDFLWFVFNPYYGIKNYKKEKVWWFAKSRWDFGIPNDYIYSFLISFLLCLLNYFLFGFDIFNFVNIVVIFAVLIVICIILAPFYHSWYKNIRKRDDRKIAGIFH